MVLFFFRNWYAYLTVLEQKIIFKIFSLNMCKNILWFYERYGILDPITSINLTCKITSYMFIIFSRIHPNDSKILSDPTATRNASMQASPRPLALPHVAYDPLLFAGLKKI